MEDLLARGFTVRLRQVHPFRPQALVEEVSDALGHPHHCFGVIVAEGPDVSRVPSGDDQRVALGAADIQERHRLVVLGDDECGGVTFDDPAEDADVHLRILHSRSGSRFRHPGVSEDRSAASVAWTKQDLSVPNHVGDVADAPLDEQLQALEAAVATNVVAQTILAETPGMNLPGWYLGAGAITGCVWNLLHGFDPRHGIKDYDLVYFDADDLSSESEAALEHQANRLFQDLGVRLDVTNEARVHLWYEERFGRAIDPYRSTEHAISTWPTTASSIGVRRESGLFTICAPFGLRDLFALVVRPNKALISIDVYEAKAVRWKAAWPELEVLEW